MHLLKSTREISSKNKKATEYGTMNEFKQIFTQLASTINGRQKIILRYFYYNLTTFPLRKDKKALSPDQFRKNKPKKDSGFDKDRDKVLYLSKAIPFVPSTAKLPYSN